MGSGELHADAGPPQPLDRFAIKGLGGLAVANQRSRARLIPQRPVSSGRPCHLAEAPNSLGRECRLSASGSRFNELDERPVGHPQLVWILAGLFSRDSRLLEPAEAVIEHRGRPISRAKPLSFSPGNDRFCDRLDQPRGFVFPASPSSEQQGAVRREIAVREFSDRFGLLGQRFGDGELAGEQLDRKA